MKRIILILAFALTGLAVWAQKPSKEPEINLDSLYQGWDDQLEELVVIGYGERKRVICQPFHAPKSVQRYDFFPTYTNL